MVYLLTEKTVNTLDFKNNKCKFPYPTPSPTFLDPGQGVDFDEEKVITRYEVKHIVRNRRNASTVLESIH